MLWRHAGSVVDGHMTLGDLSDGQAFMVAVHSAGVSGRDLPGDQAGLTDLDKMFT
jgi:hypothetical protein